MAKTLTLTLSPEYKSELELIRDKHPLPYVRERASALLKIASGISGRKVAHEGLLKKRKADTIYDWYKRFKEEEVKGLKLKGGRGRKACFSEEHPDNESARQELLHLVRREPGQFGYKQSHWTLKKIKESCSWLKVETPQGVCSVLTRLKINYKRGRNYLHSPDPDYIAKLADIGICLGKCSKRVVVLFLDELTYYRQPTLASNYEEKGPHQPLAHLSYKSNSSRRVVATLDAATGKVVFEQKWKIGLKQLVDFYEKLSDSYPGAKTIKVVQDNWPIHFHPDVIAALKPHKINWPLALPKNCPTEPSPRARRLNLPIELVPLSTYASWANLIEKLWKWLKQEVIHLHRYADQWLQLQELVDNFLNQFAHDSKELLRYLGLTSNSKLFGQVLPSWPRSP